MTVRDVIVTHLKNRGMTQAQFAKKLGVSIGTVSSTLGNEDGNNMKVSTLVRWLDVLGSQLTVDTLLDIDEEMILDLEEEGVDYDRFRHPREERRS